MKRVNLVLLCALLCASCGITKAQTTIPTKQQIAGIEMSNALSEDGTSIIQRPYRWWAGFAIVNDYSAAVRQATEDAYTTVAREFNNMVNSVVERGEITTNGRVVSAVKSYWSQVSEKLVKQCGTFGEAEIIEQPCEENNKMYTVKAKVAIRGDYYITLIENAVKGSPKMIQTNGMTPQEVDEILDLNNAILRQAKQ